MWLLISQNCYLAPFIIQANFKYREKHGLFSYSNVTYKTFFTIDCGSNSLSQLPSITSFLKVGLAWGVVFL